MLYQVEVSEDSLKDYRTAFASATAKAFENETYEIVIVVDNINSLRALSAADARHYGTRRRYHWII